MKAIFLLILSLIVAFGEVLNAIPRTSQERSSRDTSLQTLLIINAFDAASMKARTKKKELFAELADSLKYYLQRASSAREGLNVVIVPGIINVAGNYDSTIASLTRQYNASGIIVIKDLNVFFNQTNVEVTKDATGTSREASYDLCTAISYDGYWVQPTIKSSIINDCRFFTKRSVVSGLFAAGPDVVGKSKYTYDMVARNASLYISQDFPWR